MTLSKNDFGRCGPPEDGPPLRRGPLENVVQDQSREKNTVMKPKGKLQRWMKDYFQLEGCESQPELEGKYSNYEFIWILDQDQIPITVIPLESLDGVLTEIGWVNDRNEDMTVLDFLANPTSRLYKEHRKRLKVTDLKFPILIWKDVDTKKFTICDGVHRYLKAKQQGLLTIQAREVTSEHMTRIKKQRELAQQQQQQQQQQKASKKRKISDVES